VNVKFHVGRVDAEVSRQDAARLVVLLLGRGTDGAVKAAGIIMEALR